MCEGVFLPENVQKKDQEKPKMRKQISLTSKIGGSIKNTYQRPYEDQNIKVALYIIG